MRILTLILCFLLSLSAITFARENNKANNNNDTLGIFLFDRLAKAPTQQIGREVEAEIWHYWFNQAPSKQIRENLEYGRKRREAYDYEAAENAFDKVVTTAPNFAEGYNQRAFAKFLRDNHSGALQDLEKALELEPRHFGAMSGMYHVLRLMNRNAAAFRVLQDAVKIHPWIKERGALPDHMQPPLNIPLAPKPNKDIQDL